MKRMGIEGIYLGGWATSAKGSITEDPGPDLASYRSARSPMTPRYWCAPCSPQTAISITSACR